MRVAETALKIQEKPVETSQNSAEEETLEPGQEEDAASETGFQDFLSPPPAPPFPNQQFEAIGDFTAQESTDLTFKKGDCFVVLAIRDDGWWQVQGPQGQRGLAPSTYLKALDINKYDEIMEPTRAIPAQRKSDQRVVSFQETPTTTKSASFIDDNGNIKHGLSAAKSTQELSVLQSVGGLPSGFRPSTLSQAVRSNEHLSIECWLTPKLNDSNLLFQDLFWSSRNRVRRRSAKCVKILKLLKCANVPSKFSGITVLTSKVHICLFDGQHILSNVHIVRAYQSNRKPNNWNFVHTVREKHSCIDHSEMFIRTNAVGINIRILLELVLTVVREGSSDQFDVSCGWATIPLYPQSTASAEKDSKPEEKTAPKQLENQLYSVTLKGGSPFENDVPIDVSRISTNIFQKLMAESMRPYVLVRISSPTEQQYVKLDTFPDALIWDTDFIDVVYYYRRFLGEVLIRDRTDLLATDLVFEPVLATLPKIAAQPDIMDLLMICWKLKLKSMKRSEKKVEEIVKQAFYTTVLNGAVALLDVINMPQYNLEDQKSLQERKRIIDQFLIGYRSNGSSPIGWLTGSADPSAIFVPFDPIQASFNVIGTHCRL